MPEKTAEKPPVTKAAGSFMDVWPDAPHRYMLHPLENLRLRSGRYPIVETIDSEGWATTLAREDLRATIQAALSAGMLTDIQGRADIAKLKARVTALEDEVEVLKSQASPQSQTSKHSTDEVLPNVYHVCEPQRVASFLASYPNMGQTLAAAVPILRDAFGPKVVVTLDLSCEPEHPSDCELVAWIMTREAHGEAQIRLDKFDEWWFELPADKAQGLTFALRYL